MMRHVLFAAALLASCGGPSATSEPAHQTSSRSETQARIVCETEPTPPVAAEPAHVEPAAIPGPRPVLAIRGAPGRGGHVSIAIENRGTELARLAPQVMIEREQDGAFVVLPAASLTRARTASTRRPRASSSPPEARCIRPTGSARSATRSARASAVRRRSAERIASW